MYILNAPHTRNILNASASGLRNFLQRFATGIGKFSFARLGDQSFEDFEGLVKAVPSDVPAIVGARMVRNICVSPTNLSGAGWSPRNGASVDGAAVTFGAANSDIRYEANNLNKTGVFRLSADIWGDATQLDFEGVDNGDGSDAQKKRITISAEIKRYSVLVDMSSSTTFSGKLGVYFNRFASLVPPGSVVNIDNMLIEEITGQANQSPSEHVEDVQFFDYENGNTVDGNGVVTEAKGPAITGIKGVLLEGPATNKLTDSSDVANGAAWSGSDVVRSIAPVAAPDGAMTAVRLYSAGGSGYWFDASSAVAGDNKSIWARTASGTGDVGLIAHNGHGSISLTETWQRFDINYDDDLSANPQNFYAADFRIGTLNEVYVWEPQVEANSYPTSNISTQGGTGSRSATSLSETLANLGIPDLTNDFSYQFKFRPQFDGVDDKGGYQRLLQLWGDTTNHIELKVAPTSDRLFLTKKVNGVNEEASILLNSLPYITDDLISVRVSITAANGIKFWVNSLPVRVATGATAKGDMAIPISRVYINSAESASLSSLSMISESLTIHPEALSDAKLDALT